MCVFCGECVDESDRSRFVVVPCNVRAFLNQPFGVWRCSQCRTIHCRDVVDLDQYYEKYPIRGGELNWATRLVFRTLLGRLRRHGFDRGRSLLDYGCGGGTFVRYLREKGYGRVDGYDPYGSADAFGNKAVLAARPFDYLLLQDVIEHVEEPAALLGEIDRYVAPGGHILIGTPNADCIDLKRTDLFINELHVPYHLHLLTRETLESLGRVVGWTPVGFWSRAHFDYPFMGLNARAGREYQRLMDGSVDALFDPPRIGQALASPRFMFYAVFGYLLSFRANMAVMFRKQNQNPERERAGAMEQ